tara:strand:+ start:106 stop:462 length:357 start_codon:yes stop_codon:yes gene_type:complete
MKKFLYFAVSAPDGTTSTEQVVTFPADQLSHFEMHNATTLRAYFNSTQDQNVVGIDAPVVALTITSGKHKEVMEALSGAIASANAINAPMIVVADSENSKFLHVNITACASIGVVDAS